MRSSLCYRVPRSLSTVESSTTQDVIETCAESDALALCRGNYELNWAELNPYLRMPGVEGEFVLGLLESLPVCCREASENILFAL